MSELNTESVAPIAPKVVARLGLEDEIVTKGARERIDLREPGFVYGVLEGYLDVFFVEEPGADGFDGRRHFTAQARAGALVASLEPSGPTVEALDGWDWIAVPSNGARIVRIPLATILELGSGSVEDRRLLNEIVTSSVVQILSGLQRDRETLLAAHRLAVDETASVEQGEMVSAAEPLVWVRAPENSLAAALFPGLDDPPSFPKWGAEWAPVGRAYAWRANEAFEARAVTSEEFLDAADLKRDLFGFFAYVIEARRRWFVATAEAERRESDERLRFSVGSFRDSINALGNVLVRKSRVPISGGDIPLAAGLRMVARAEGHTLELTTSESVRLANAADPVGAILEKGGAGPRPVELAGRWWRQDHGALLAYRGPERQPYALLPRFGKRSYWAVDPATGARQKLDDAMAAEFAEDATAVVRPFDENQRLPLGLFSFGLRGAGWDLTVVFLMMILTALAGMATPIVTGEIMGPVTAAARENDLFVLLGVLFVVGGASVSFGFVEAIASLRVEGRMGNSVQTAVWLRLLELPMNFFQRFSIGDLVNRADGIDSMRSLISSSTTRAVLHAVSGLASFCLLIYYEWRSALVVGAIGSFYFLVAVPSGFVFLAIRRELQDIVGETEGLIFQLLTNQAKLRVAGAERIAFGRWAKLYGTSQRYVYKDRLVNLTLGLLKGSLRMVALASILFVVGWQSGALVEFFETPESLSQISSDLLITIMPTGTFVSFNVAMGQFLTALFSLGETGISLLTAIPLYHRVKPILEAPREADEEARLVLDRLDGRVEFANVAYRYGEDDPLVLDGLSFRVEPGEMVALVGASGAGKSTIMRLLLGFDTPEQGSILVDGTPLDKLDKRALRSSLGVVLQNAQLLAGSVLENISGGTDLSEDAAWAAARLAGLDEDLKEMPMGMQTFIMEGSGTISGGQRQRILVARALARRPRLILFDEATSALDNTSQQRVTESLAELSVSRIVIAHRLSTIVSADRIYFIGRGKALEEGTYDELMERGGEFSELARRQIL